MKERGEIQFILTGRLNQNCVENLFSIIRGKGGKIPVDTCQDCSNQLIPPKLPSPYDELSVYEFLQNKTYQEVGSLMYPTPAMITFVDRLETLFSGIFKGIIHMPEVLARLCKCAGDFCTFLKCKAVKCSLWLKSVVKLYMKVQIFHALKRCNVQINQEKMGKCNRKMLKLSYLLLLMSTLHMTKFWSSGSSAHQYSCGPTAAFTLMQLANETVLVSSSSLALYKYHTHLIHQSLVTCHHRFMYYHTSEE